MSPVGEARRSSLAFHKNLLKTFVEVTIWGPGVHNPVMSQLKGEW